VDFGSSTQIIVLVFKNTFLGTQLGIANSLAVDFEGVFKNLTNRELTLGELLGDWFGWRVSLFVVSSRPGT